MGTVTTDSQPIGNLWKLSVFPGLLPGVPWVLTSPLSLLLTLGVEEERVLPAGLLAGTRQNAGGKQAHHQGIRTREQTHSSNTGALSSSCMVLGHRSRGRQ